MNNTQKQKDRSKSNSNNKYFTNFYEENEQPPTNRTLRNDNQENDTQNTLKLLKKQKSFWQRWNKKRDCEVKSKQSRELELAKLFNSNTKKWKEAI